MLNCTWLLWHITQLQVSFWSSPSMMSDHVQNILQTFPQPALYPLSFPRWYIKNDQVAEILNNILKNVKNVFSSSLIENYQLSEIQLKTFTMHIICVHDHFICLWESLRKKEKYGNRLTYSWTNSGVTMSLLGLLITAKNNLNCSVSA